jgi:hypothetical protein
MPRFTLEMSTFVITAPWNSDAAPEFLAMEMALKSLGAELIDMSGTTYTYRVPSLVFTFKSRAKKLGFTGHEMLPDGTMGGWF